MVIPDIPIAKITPHSINPNQYALGKRDMIIWIPFLLLD